MTYRNPEPQILDERSYEEKCRTRPVVEAWTRLGWLQTKQHFGPVSVQEIEEISRLIRKKDKDSA